MYQGMIAILKHYYMRCIQQQAIAAAIPDESIIFNNFGNDTISTKLPRTYGYEWCMEDAMPAIIE